MAFKMRGKPVIQGTDDHRTIAKAMQDSPVNGNAFTKAMADAGGNYQKAKEILENSPGNMNSPADAMDSPADAMETPAKVLAPVVRTAGKIMKIVPKVSKKAKNVVDDVVEYVPKKTKTFYDKAKKALGYGTVGAAGAGVGAGINETASDAKKKVEEEVSGGSKGGSKSSSSGAYSKAAKRGKEMGYDLKELINQRKSVKKGSPEYNAIQNKINRAYGVKKRHGATSETTTGTKGVRGGKDVKTTTKNVPGISDYKAETVTSRGGRKKVTTERFEDDQGVTTKKHKSKYRKSGVEKKRKSVYKTDFDKDSKVDKKTTVKVKKDKTGKVKRKKHVRVEDGRRTVTKTDAQGKETTKSRRTIKGFLTGKGKKKKEDQ